MSTHSSTQKKYIIYDHYLECLKEIDIQQGGHIDNDVKQLLNKSVLFLHYENTYYYRDVEFLQ
jgi:hypothetical protein